MSNTMQYIADIPAYIFGAESQAVTLSERSLESAVTTPVWLLGVSAVVVVAYLVWLNYWSVQGHKHRSLLSMIVRRNATYVEKLEEVTPSFLTYINSGTLLSFVAIWFTLIVWSGLIYVEQHTLLVYVLAAIYLVYIYQVSITGVIGFVVESQRLTEWVVLNKRIYCTALAITAIPTILCYSLSQGVVHAIFAYIVYSQLFIVLVLYLFKTIKLFISKKVSLLHTILYLCAVEIFPVTLIWGFLQDNFV